MSEISVSHTSNFGFTPFRVGGDSLGKAAPHSLMDVQSPYFSSVSSALSNTASVNTFPSTAKQHKSHVEVPLASQSAFSPAAPSNAAPSNAEPSNIDPSSTASSNIDPASTVSSNTGTPEPESLKDFKYSERQSFHHSNQDHSHNSRSDSELREGKDMANKARHDNELLNQQKLMQLKLRDQEVRNHEQAHARAGQGLTGAPVYQYEKGPDGRNYAVSGEVSIDLSSVPNNPEATLERMQQVRRAALAPANPSSQDRRIAALASQKMMDSQRELLQQEQELSQLEAQLAQAEREMIREELSEARAQQGDAQADQMGGDYSQPVSAADQFAGINARARHINETLLRITQPFIIRNGQLFEDDA